MDVKAYLEEYYPDIEILTIDGFDEAFVGVGTQFNRAVACYDEVKILKTLIERDNMSLEEAEEYVAFNISGAYVGEKTPVLVQFAGDDV